jgi:hypothetical protein
MPPYSCYPDRGIYSYVGTATRLPHVHVCVADDSIKVLLARWEKILGLMKDLSVPLADVADVRVVEDPMREARGTGLKAGLRLPGVYFVARTIRLDRAFIVKRGLPALSFSVRNHPPLESVLVSTPDARELARLIGSRSRFHTTISAPGTEPSRSSN